MNEPQATPIPKPAPKLKAERKELPRKRATKRRAAKPAGPTPKQLKAKATRLHSLIVRAEGKCQAQSYQLPSDPPFCGAVCHCETAPAKHSTDCPLECAHIITRGRAHTRTAEDNAMALCSRHHRWFTLHPVEWGRFVLGHIGEAAYLDLRRRALDTSTMRWAPEVERLEQRARELGIR